MASHEQIMSLLQRNANYNDYSGSTMGAGYIGGKRGRVGRCPRGMKRQCVKGKGYIGGCAGCGMNCMHCGAGVVGGDGYGYVGGMDGGFKGEQLLRKKYLAKYPNDKKKRDRLFNAYLKRHNLTKVYAKELKNRTDAAHARKGKPKRKAPVKRKQRTGENYISWRAGFIKKWKANSGGETPDKLTISEYWLNHKSRNGGKLRPEQQAILNNLEFSEPEIGWGRRKY